MKQLREQGWIVEKVEYWNPFAKKRHDLFNVADLIAVKGTRTLAIQVTTLNHLKEHIDKLSANELLPVLLKAWDIEIHAWRKLKTGWEPEIHKFQSE